MKSVRIEVFDSIKRTTKIWDYRYLYPFDDRVIALRDRDFNETIYSFRQLNSNLSALLEPVAGMKYEL